jgi:hypothetical protein
MVEIEHIRQSATAQRQASVVDASIALRAFTAFAVLTVLARFGGTKYHCSLIQSRLAPVDTEPAQDDIDEDADLASCSSESETPADAYIEWMKLLVVHGTAYQRLSRQTRRSTALATLQVDLIEYPVPDQKMLPWKEVVRSLVSADAADRYIQAIQAIGRNPAKFSGTVHCEAALVALLHTPQSPPFLNVDKTIGVSKRSCVVCAELLNILNENSPKPYLYRKAHQNITGCTLPEELPVAAHRRMVEHFGRLLVSCLEELAPTQGRQPRSADSEGESSGSDESSEWGELLE